MDWTQALSQFAGGYANALMKRRQLDESRAIRQASLKQKQAQWAAEQALKLRDFDYKRGRDKVTDEAAAEEREAKDYNDVFNSNIGNLEKELANIRSITNPESRKQAIESYRANRTRVLGSLRSLYERSPRLRSRFKDVSFDDLMNARASTFLNEPSSFPVDLDKIDERITKKLGTIMADPGLTGNAEFIRASFQPEIDLLKSSGMTNEQIFSRFPMLRYGRPVASERDITSVIAGTPYQRIDSRFAPEDIRRIGFLPDPVVIGDVGYRRAVPDFSGADEKIPFQSAVGRAVNTGVDLDRFLYGGINFNPNAALWGGSLLPQLPEKTTKQNRIESILNNEEFKKLIGVTDNYASDESKRKALGSLYSLYPKAMSGASGKKLAEYLTAAPLEKAPTVTTKVPVEDIAMPPITETKRAEVEKLKKGNQLADLEILLKADEVDFKDKTLAARIAEARQKPILEKLRYELDKYVRQSGVTNAAANTQINRARLALSREEFNVSNVAFYGKVVDAFRALKSAANTEVETQSKALGASLNQTIIGNLAGKAGLDGKALTELAQRLKDGKTTEDDNKTIDKIMASAGQLGPAAITLLKNISAYNSAIKRRDKYNGPLDQATKFYAEVVGTTRPGERPVGLPDINIPDDFEEDISAPAETPNPPPPPKPTQSTRRTPAGPNYPAGALGGTGAGKKQDKSKGSTRLERRV